MHIASTSRTNMKRPATATATATDTQDTNKRAKAGTTHTFSGSLKFVKHFATVDDSCTCHCRCGNALIGEGKVTDFCEAFEDAFNESDMVTMITLPNSTFDITDAFRARLLEEGYDAAYGARPLRRAIMRLVEDKLAESMLSGALRDDCHALLDVSAGDITVAVTVASAEPAVVKKTLNA